MYVNASTRLGEHVNKTWILGSMSTPTPRRCTTKGSGRSTTVPSVQIPRRSKRWRRMAVRVLAIVLFNAGAGAAGVEAYIEPVPLPGASLAPTSAEAVTQRRIEAQSGAVAARRPLGPADDVMRTA